MDKRILFTGFTILIVLSIIISVFVIHSRSRISANPIRVIPQDALVIVRVNGPELIYELSDKTNPVWASASRLPVLEDFQNNLEELDSLTKNHPDIWRMLFQNGFFVSGHHTGSKKIQFLGITMLPADIKEREIIKILNEFSKKRIENTIRKYEGKSIHTLSIEIKNSNINYFFTVINNLFLISKSPILVEDAIRQSSLSTSLNDNREFSSVINTTGKNKAGNIYIDFRKYGKLFFPIVNDEFSKKIVLESSFGGWTELDINLMKDLILFNGFISKTDSSSSFISTISPHDPVDINVAEILPAEVTTLIAFGIAKPAKYYEDYKKYLRENNKYAEFNKQIKKINSDYHLDLENFMLEILDDELALAHTQQWDPDDGTHFIALKCKSGSLARKRLESLLEDYQNIDRNMKLFYEYSPDNELKWPIYRLPVNNLFGQLFGELFAVFEENYFTIIDNYLVFSDSFKSVSKVVYSHILNKTLDTDMTYRDYLTNISQKSFILFYSNIARSQSFFKPFLSQEVMDIWERHIQVFQQTQALGFQVSKVSNLPYANLLIKNYSWTKGKPSTVWETLMDTTASLKPQFVKNHYTGQNELVVQDMNHNLYLINKAGRILWKLNVISRINSKIYQVDYYKNQKLQLLFSTEDHIHLIDRNGNYVDRYPVRLREKASAGLSLFDYDNNKNYRLFIPCIDKKVYAYSVDGAILAGWEFEKTDYIVTSPVNHFRVNDKDFIVFGDRSRTYIVDRRGNTRVDVKKQFNKSAKNNYYLNNTGSIETSYIVTTDTSGTVYKIGLDGTTDITELKTFSGKHFFDFKDINGDGTNNYIFLDQNQLCVYKPNGEELFSRSFDMPVNNPPIYFHFSFTDRKLGLLSAENQQIFLINKDGSNYDGFPLTGNTPFSIGFLESDKSRFNLIVGGRNNFLYNYTVE